MPRKAYGQAITSIAISPQPGEFLVEMMWVSFSCEHLTSRLPPFCITETVVSGQLPVYLSILSSSDTKINL